MKSPFNFNLPNDNPGFSQEKLLEFFEKNPDVIYYQTFVFLLFFTLFLFSLI